MFSDTCDFGCILINIPHPSAVCSILVVWAGPIRELYVFMLARNIILGFLFVTRAPVHHNVYWFAWFCSCYIHHTQCNCVRDRVHSGKYIITNSNIEKEKAKRGVERERETDRKTERKGQERERENTKTSENMAMTVRNLMWTVFLYHWWKANFPCTHIFFASD